MAKVTFPKFGFGLEGEAPRDSPMTLITSGLSADNEQTRASQNGAVGPVDPNDCFAIPTLHRAEGMGRDGVLHIDSYTPPDEERGHLVGRFELDLPGNENSSVVLELDVDDVYSDAPNTESSPDGGVDQEPLEPVDFGAADGAEDSG